MLNKKQVKLKFLSMSKHSSQSLFVLTPLLLVIIIDTMGFGLIIPILSPLFMEHTGAILPSTTSLAMRDFLYGLSMASFTATMLLGAPFLGDLSDHWGRKKILIVSLIGTAIALLISAYGILIHNVVLLILGRALAGFAAGSQPIAQAAIADVSSHDNKAKNMAMLGFVSCAGFVIGPIIGGYFANPAYFNYATPFFIAATLAFANAVAVNFTFRETFHPKHQKKLELLKGLVLFIDAFKNREIRGVIGAMLFYQIGFAIYLTFISIFVVQSFHFSTTKVGHFMAYFGLIMALTYILIMPNIVRIASLKNIVRGGLVVTVITLLCLLWPIQWVVWITMIPLAASNGITYTATLTLLSNQMSSEKQGWIMGVIAATTATAWGVGSLLAGALGSGNILLPFLTAAGLTFFGLILFQVSMNRANP